MKHKAIKQELTPEEEEFVKLISEIMVDSVLRDLHQLEINPIKEEIKKEKLSD